MAIHRILLVDDDPDIRRIGQLCLVRLGGWEVELADSGQACLELAASWGPDLILLDVMMPGLDGPATLSELQRTPATATIPVIFMTARVQEHEVESYLAQGATGVVAKPFDPMLLPGQLRDIVER